MYDLLWKIKNIYYCKVTISFMGTRALFYTVQHGIHSTGPDVKALTYFTKQSV